MAKAKNELHQAIERNEIIPYFQPIVDLRSLRLTGFEALARWKHPSQGVLLPSEFIPSAEATGVIRDLTESLLKQACHLASDWPDHVQLSVNISPQQLRDAALPEQIRRVVETASMPPDRLTLEITEAALVEEVESVREISEELKGLGVKLALDDFGTGYSSLRQLQILPIDSLKIDAAFVRTMAYERESRKIVAAVMGLGQSLGLSTTAEGVESQAHANMLACMGCDAAQGWLFGRPVPAEDVPEIIANRTWRRPVVRNAARNASYAVSPLDVPFDRCLGQLQALYNGAPIGLGLLDTNFRYVALNKQLADLNRRPVSAHLGKPLDAIVPGQFGRIRPLLLRALAGETVYDECVYVDRRISSSKQSLITCYQPVYDAAGEATGISVVVVASNVAKSDATGRATEIGRVVVDNNRPRLTPRQQDVLRLLVEGHSAKEIACRLDIAVSTIKTHLASIYSALGARNRVEAIIRLGELAERNGLRETALTAIGGPTTRSAPPRPAGISSASLDAENSNLVGPKSEFNE